MEVPVWGLVPFVVMLAAIAIFPLWHVTEHIWEKNTVKLALALVLGIPVGVWMWVAYSPELVVHELNEYAQFISLLFSLFVVSGGIFVAGDIKATPRNNTLLLAAGGVLASFIGTTGAAMLLIRPLLNTNKERERKIHTVIFAILIVANCGGLLTPLGDPPLYIGMMRGVPFTWTFSLWPQWLFVVGMLLLSYYGLDRRAYAKETDFHVFWDEHDKQPISVRGLLNIVWFLVIIASVAFLGDYEYLKIGVQLLAALASFYTTKRSIRFDDNEFTWSPILEVAALFIGIFLTMIPALEFLRAHAHSMPLNEYTFFAFTGVLSSVLDNAPTYLTFFEMGTQFTLGNAVAGVPELYLAAISTGAVFCGAMTYIGNGPNFMVKAVAEEKGVPMPSFGGYIVYSLRDLAPILVAQAMIFLSDGGWVRIVGILIAMVVAAIAARNIVRNPLPETVDEAK
ncbi:MAG: sodium:proton antiporter [Propionibacteriaceae bacterium]|jgi:Na+/H+ antiporter NhaD/arsenite permease-like protein|nr:sodium:proton antiporter [Propionibacteriaceae bacterium]